MRKKRRIKKSVLVFGMILLCTIIITSILIIIGKNYYEKIHSYKYKLEKIGYSTEEIDNLLKLDQNNLDDLLKREYSKVIPKLVVQEHFIYDNLDRYLAYYEKNKTYKKDVIVTKVNVNRDYDFYTNTSLSDTSMGNLILVNKYNNLKKDYEINDLEDVSVLYMYGNQKIRKEVYDKFKELFYAAKEDNITIIINSSYRTYEYQENLWNNYAKVHGEKWADSYAARAGYSEHQTGLAIDVTTYGVKNQEDFENTEAFNWMSNNSYKYGFILRYPKGKEDITGYSYESWHYRYLGVEEATKVYNSGLTYDEYYNYYLKK